jgi:uncharacterized Rmd1/YagE family protein
MSKDTKEPEAENGKETEEIYFSDRKEIEIRAWFLGQRIDLKSLEQSRKFTASPYIIRAGHDGYAVLFRYGTVVLFGMGAIEETSFLNDIKPYIIDPFERIEMESTEAVVDESGSEGVDPSHIRVKTWDHERIQLVAEVLAKSAVLSYYETRISETFDKIDPIASELQSGTVKGKSSRHILRHIGTTLSIQRKMAGHVGIDEKPDIIWDNPELEKLFLRMADEYEIKERYTALRHKLELIHRTAETMNGLLQDKRALAVEWYIVILIIVEIVLILLEPLIGI